MIKEQAMLAELEQQRNWALTRCAEYAAKLAEALTEIESLKKEQGEQNETSNRI